MILIRNATLLDPASGELTENASVVVEDERIREVSPRPITVSATLTLDAGRRTLMPGLIDNHVHVFLSEVNIRALEAIPLTLMTARGAGLMRAMLDRGFTTVRDTGGADWGIREGVAQGHLPGPRLFVAGRPIGQTSGHSDSRRRTDTGSPCHCCNALAFTAGVADGVDEVRRAVREQLRQGVDHIKIMASGGVASPYDPLESLQYTTDEIRAAVRGGRGLQEVRVRPRLRGRGDRARRRERRARDRARQSHRRRDGQADGRARAPSWCRPSSPTTRSSATAARWGMGADSLEKNKVVMAAGLRSLELAREAGVRMAFGSDLLGQLQPDQSTRVPDSRAGALAARDHPLGDGGGRRAARAPGELGTIAPGAFADLLVVDGNPLRDLSVLLRARASTCR